MTEIIGGLLLLVVVPLVGAIPLKTHNRNLNRGLELLQGLVVVAIAQYCFAGQREWDFIALIAWSAGRYWTNQSVGWLGVIAGYLLHDPWGGGFVGLLGLISLSLLRSPVQAQFGLAILIPLMELLRNPLRGSLVVVAAFMTGLLYWMGTKTTGQTATFQAFRGTTLDDDLDGKRVGEKAARLAQLKRAGIPVPAGWVLQAGQDPSTILSQLNPFKDQTWIVRLSPIGGGHYDALPNLRDPDLLWRSIVRAFEIYDSNVSVRYRSDRGFADQGTAVLIQKQIVPVRYSGISYIEEKHRNSTNRSDVPLEILLRVEILTKEAATKLKPTPKYLEWVYDEQVWVIQVEG
ncbi:MAG: hypothetical protein HC860_22165 [Alkalinema sp. RU_4_3]|nr:hypothetical protein [Alkalinema sp. RU_4_3]